jgi:hypothetical protein
LHSEIDADFESAEKVVKKFNEKINEKMTEKWSFLTFLLSAKVFG